MLNESIFNCDYIDSKIKQAFRRAYQDSLDNGLSVIISDNGNLVEVFPDGKIIVIKKLDS